MFYYIKEDTRKFTRKFYKNVDTVEEISSCRGCGNKKKSHIYSICS